MFASRGDVAVSGDVLIRERRVGLDKQTDQVSQALVLCIGKRGRLGAFQFNAN